MAVSSNSTQFSLRVQVALQLLRLDEPPFDAWALVRIDLAHFVSDFGTIVEAPCLFVSVPLKRLLSGSWITWNKYWKWLPW